MTRTKTVRIVLTSAASLLILIALVLLAIFTYGFKPLNLGNTVTYIEFTPGTSFTKLAYELAQKKIINSPKRFIWLGKLGYHTNQLQAGEYALYPNMTVSDLLKKLQAGDTYMHNITIIEGWTFSQMKNALDKNPAIAHSLKNKSPEQIMAIVSGKQQPAEGWFFPDTYQFPKGTKDKVIYEKAYQAMQGHLDLAWQERDMGLPYASSYEALIAASLIEKETALEQEKPIIADVIIKRLDKGMRLQIDPTVIYGLGDKYTGRLHRQDLLIDTPYNTYLHRGLPPTPIALPGLASIKAAVAPADTQYYYFVAKGDGSHAFSANLQEHQQKIKDYLLNRNVPNEHRKSTTESQP